MFVGVTALLGRSLRIDARSWQAHLARLGLMVGIYVSLSFAFALASRFGAPGLRFFSANVYLNVVFLTLLGVGFFSTAITEEKEEDTLGLMLMAGISPLGLLIGKLGGRLIQALLLIVVQYPFTLLAITMGGVSPSQVQAAYVGLVSYMLLLAGGGLLCSTLAPRSRTAGTWMVVALFVYGLVPLVCDAIYNRIARSSATEVLWCDPLLETVASLSLFQRIDTILATGFGESPWSRQAVSNLVLGLVGFALSWCCFGYASREPATEATARGGLSRSRTGLARSFSPGRAWGNPFAWKDFHFVAGGLSRRLLRIQFYPALFGFSLGHSVVWGNGSMDDALGIYQVLVLLAVLWDLSILAARLIHDEVRGQTIAALVMLPHSVRYVFYSKLLGAVAGMYPGLVCFLVANVIGIKHVVDFFRVDGLSVIALLLLVPHFAAVYALFVRWGAVPLAIGSMIAVYFAIVALFQIVRLDHFFALNLITFVMLLICAACHVVVLWRIPYVASR